MTCDLLGMAGKSHVQAGWRSRTSFRLSGAFVVDPEGTMVSTFHKESNLCSHSPIALHIYLGNK